MPESLAERIADIRRLPPWKLKKQPGTRGTNGDDPEELDHRWEALQLRKAGFSFAKIGEKMGCAPSAAREWVQWCLYQAFQEPADELRQLEMERLDELQQALWPNAVRGDLGCVDRVLKIMERRDKIAGLEKTEIDVNLIYMHAQNFAKQLGIPVENILNEAEDIVRLQMATPVEAVDYDAYADTIVRLEDDDDGTATVTTAG